MNIKIAALAVLSCAGLAACASTSPGTATSSGPVQAPSGITSSNGGSQRALGNTPSVGINGTTGQTTVGTVPNGKGNAY